MLDGKEVVYPKHGGAQAQRYTRNVLNVCGGVAKNDKVTCPAADVEHGDREDRRKFVRRVKEVGKRQLLSLLNTVMSRTTV